MQSKRQSLPPIVLPMQNIFEKRFVAFLNALQIAKHVENSKRNQRHITAVVRVTKLSMFWLVACSQMLYRIRESLKEELVL